MCWQFWVYVDYFCVPLACSSVPHFMLLCLSISYSRVDGQRGVTCDGSAQCGRPCWLFICSYLCAWTRCRCALCCFILWLQAHGDAAACWYCLLCEHLPWCFCAHLPCKCPLCWFASVAGRQASILLSAAGDSAQFLVAEIRDYASWATGSFE